ncbi:bifunctional demethylmenaquinone methyltransferase/2-methoxy-6-polyprenyl-1,4-benzoquinol methylase UbiE [Arsenophonus symbiont of Ornithomya chloropus]|uniref:bifunctional demethylmenaquinone methyltransferase/2-methoxy-6-polyprenyl-1,4-benzoquinol methylase UbiE n=1 Tax=Arsenophonus symbiont of Ornithomya chloropus TaxID=634121 RepID=UPI0032B25DC6
MKKKKYLNFHRNNQNNIVETVFHSVASKYDLMNDLMSFGIHRIWKNFTIKTSGACRGQFILDLAGGTGDLTAKFSKIIGHKGKIILVDINSSMLEIGRKKLRNIGIIGNVYYIQANAEELPFSDNYFDCISISFGLRNIANKKKALQSMFRVLKPGGRLLVLEFSKPISPFVQKIFDLYSFIFLPSLGKIITKDADSYRYLAESIRMHPDQKTIKKMMEFVGFKKVSYTNMTGGIVALHRGFKFTD